MRRAALAPAAAALIAVAPAALAMGPSTPQASPLVVRVGTSRGEHDLLVYAPGAPRAGAGSAGPATADPAPAPERRPLVLLVSGEGGWRRFDQRLAGWIADAGFTVGGVSAVDYFWEPQDDRQRLASDFRSYAAALASAAGRSADAPLVLAGFSFGADLAPWLAGAGGWDGRVHGLLMIGPDETGSLSFRVVELLGFQPNDHAFSVGDALRSAAGVPVVFIHGEKDGDSYAPALLERAERPKRIISVAGADHHFSGREKELRAALLEGLEWIESAAASRPAH